MVAPPDNIVCYPVCVSTTWSPSLAMYPSGIFLAARWSIHNLFLLVSKNKLFFSRCLASPNWQGLLRCSAGDSRFCNPEKWEDDPRSGARAADQGDCECSVGGNRTSGSWRRRPSKSHVHGECRDGHASKFAICPYIRIFRIRMDIPNGETA